MSRGRPKSRIHAGLVGARALVGSDYMADRELRRQYDADIAPRTLAALGKIFAQVANRLHARPRVLDLGAGTGAAGRAVGTYFGAACEVVAVDKVGGDGGGPAVMVADVTRDVRPAGVVGRFDLVIAAHLLNELALDVSTRALLVAGWCRELLADGGLCVLVEPALPEISRQLLLVRDRLVMAGLHVVAPCFFVGPCPALDRARDFCHDSAAWPDGREARGRSRVDFSYLVLARDGQSTRDPDVYRVVSDPIKDKGRLRLFGCGGIGRHALVRLDRDRRAGNSTFDRATRGDVITVTGTQAAGDGLRLSDTSAVAKVSG